MPTNVIVNEIFENFAPNAATPETRSLIIGPLHQIRKQVSFGVYDQNDITETSYAFPGVYAGATPNVFFFEPVVSDSVNYKVRFPHLTEDEDNNLTYIIENPNEFVGYQETITSSGTFELFHAQPVKGSVKMFTNIMLSAPVSAFSASGLLNIKPICDHVGSISSVTVSTSGDVLIEELTLGTDVVITGDATTDYALAQVSTTKWATYSSTNDIFKFYASVAWPASAFSANENTYTLTVGDTPTFSTDVVGVTITNVSNFVEYDFFPVVGPALFLYDRATSGQTAVSPRNYTVKESGSTNLVYLSPGLGNPILDLGTLAASSYDAAGTTTLTVTPTGSSTWSFFPIVANGDKATGNYLKVVYGGTTYLHEIIGVNIDGSISASGNDINGTSYSTWDGNTVAMSVVYGDYSSTIIGTFSAIRTDKAGYIYSASTMDDVASQLEFGSTDEDYYVEPANPLAFAMSVALANGVNNILFTPVETDDLSGYEDALDGAGADRTVYEIFALTLEKDIHDAVEAHCRTFSDDTLTGDNKKRACMVVLSMENAVPITDSVDTAHPAIRKGYAPVLAAGDATKLQITQSTADFFGDGVSIGDRVKILTGANAGDYLVYHVGTSTLTVINDLTTTAPVVGAGEAATFNTCGFIVYKNYKTSKSLYASKIAALASSYSASDVNYRVKVMWPYVWEDFTLADGRTSSLPGYFAAAGYAGVFSSIRPQQGLTRFPLGGVGTPKYVNEYFSYADLNTIENGAMWVMYRTGTGTACREQYTAAGGVGGEALAGQRSIVCIADVISKRLHDTLYAYTGIYNITPQNIPMFRSAVEAVLNKAKNESYSRIGPLIINGRVESISVSTDTPRQINLIVAITCPEPVDVFYITLNVRRFTGQ